MITGRSQEDDINAQAAAARALEMAFLKKKQVEKEMAEEEEEEEEAVPIPAKRQSVKRASEAETGRAAVSPMEYKTVAPPGSGSGPAISFTDFSSSGTDYSGLGRAGPV